MAKTAAPKSPAPGGETEKAAASATATSPTAPAFQSMPGGAPFFELSRLMVVAIDTSAGRLIQKAQTAPNGPWPAAWSIIAPGTFVQMTAGITKDGRVAVVAQLTGSPNLFFITEDANQVGPIDKWTAPMNIGAPAGAVSYSGFSMARDVDGRIELFVLDNQARIWWIYQNPDQIVQVQKTITPPGTTTPIVVTVEERVPPAQMWSDWLQIPGGLVSISAIRQADGTIALFGINSGANLYRCQQKTAQALKVTDWTGWTQIDTSGTGGFTAMAPVVGPLGATNLFALTKSGQALHTRQKPAGTATWTPWATTGYSRVGKYTLASGIEGNGDIMLVASDVQHVHAFNTQYDAATQNWSGWRDFNASSSNTRLMLDYNADGRLAVFSLSSGAAGNSNSLWTLSQMSIDSTEWEYSWVSLADSNVSQAIVVRDLTPPV